MSEGRAGIGPGQAIPLPELGRKTILNFVLGLNPKYFENIRSELDPNPARAQFGWPESKLAQIKLERSEKKIDWRHGGRRVRASGQGEGDHSKRVAGSREGLRSVKCGHRGQKRVVRVGGTTRSRAWGEEASGACTEARRRLEQGGRRGHAEPGVRGEGAVRTKGVGAELVDSTGCIVGAWIGDAPRDKVRTVLFLDRI